jgi:outer membrane protein OmpA-like peptidoglycan-associated protein
MRSGKRIRAAVTVAVLAALAQGCASAGVGLGGPGFRACAPYMLGGAAIGGGLGASTATDRRERVRRGTAGAAAGAVAGYAVCTQVWQQKQELETEFAALDAALPATGGGEAGPTERVVMDVVPVDNNSALRLDLNLMFATGEARLEPRVTSHLRVIATNLLSRPNSAIRVVGHTDSSGDPDRNRVLSHRRAESVADYLASQGVDRTRLTTQGMGSDSARADNRDPAGRALNRRVEVFIYPNPA